MNIIRKLKRFSIIGLSVCAGCSVKWILIDGRVFAAEQNNSISEENIPELRLKHVQIIFRHGARTPLHLTPGIEEAVYPADYLLRHVPYTQFDIQFVHKDGSPLKPSQYDAHYEETKLRGGCTGGLLTSYGYDQMYMLGKRLRRDYIDNLKFLEAFDPELVDLTTTHMSRTKASLQSVLAGLFGAENLKKQGPVVVKSNHTKDEILVPSPDICPVFRKINHAAMVHYKDLEEFKDDGALIRSKLGEHHFKKKGVNFIDIRDDIVARKTHGLPIPEQITPDIFQMIDRNATKLMYYANCGKHEAERMVAVRLSMGRTMKKFLDNIKDNISGKSKVKMHFYSAHDSSVFPVLAMLGLDVSEWPPFGADLIVELYEDVNKSHFIKVKYLGKPQIVRGCDKELCPLDQFLEALSPYQIDDVEYKQLCRSNILEVIAKGLARRRRREMIEEAEDEDEESKQRSDYAAGL